MLSDRIKQVRTLLKISQKEFGERLGVSRDVIANIEYKRVEPQKIFIDHLISTFSVNPKWLENGENPVFYTRNKNVDELMKIFEALEPDMQNFALKQIREILRLQEKPKKDES